MKMVRVELVNSEKTDCEWKDGKLVIKGESVQIAGRNRLLDDLSIIYDGACDGTEIVSADKFLYINLFGDGYKEYFINTKTRYIVDLIRMYSDGDEETDISKEIDETLNELFSV